MRFGLGILGLRVRARARARLRIYACRECRDGADAQYMQYVKAV